MSKEIWRSDKFLTINAKINSSSGLPISCNIKFLHLDLRSSKLKFILTIDIDEVTIKYLFSCSIKLKKYKLFFSSIFSSKFSKTIFWYNFASLIFSLSKNLHQLLS